MTSKQSFRSRDPRLQRRNFYAQNAQLAGLPGGLESNLPVHPAHHPFAKDCASVVLQPVNDQMHRPRPADGAYAVGHHQHSSVQSVWYSWHQSQAAAASADYMCVPAVHEGFASSSTGSATAAAELAAVLAARLDTQRHAVSQKSITYQLPADSCRPFPALLSPTSRPTIYAHPQPSTPVLPHTRSLHHPDISARCSSSSHTACYTSRSEDMSACQPTPLSCDPAMPYASSWHHHDTSAHCSDSHMAVYASQLRDASTGQATPLICDPTLPCASSSYHRHPCHHYSSGRCSSSHLAFCASQPSNMTCNVPYQPIPEGCDRGCKATLEFSAAPVFDMPVFSRLPPNLPIWQLDIAGCQQHTSCPQTHPPFAAVGVSDMPAGQQTVEQWQALSANTRDIQWEALKPAGQQTLEQRQALSNSRHDMQWEALKQQFAIILPAQDAVEEAAAAEQQQLSISVEGQQLKPVAEPPQGMTATPQQHDIIAAQAPGSQPNPEPAVKKKKVRRARILKEGSLTMIPYGMNERLLWTHRIAQFMSQARGVLGDRSFRRPWGGSVLDSVIGTFLTQNVADQLSSKAYMTLAAVFPAKPVAVKAAGWGSCGAAAASTDARPPTEETSEVCAGKVAVVADDGWVDYSDTVNWEAVRLAKPAKVAEAIQCRGMHNRLADSIQAFLNRLHCEASAAHSSSHHHILAAPPDSMDVTTSHTPPTADITHEQPTPPFDKPLDLSPSHQLNLADFQDSMDVPNPHTPDTADMTCVNPMLPCDTPLNLNASMTESHNHSMPDATIVVSVSQAQSKTQQLRLEPTDSMATSHDHMLHGATGVTSHRQLQHSSELASDRGWSPEAQQVAVDWQHSEAVMLQTPEQAVDRPDICQAASDDCSSVADQTNHLRNQQWQSPPFQASMQEQAGRPQQLQTARHFCGVEHVHVADLADQLVKSAGQSGTTQLPSSEAQMVSDKHEAAAAAAADPAAEPAAVQMHIPRQNQTSAVQCTVQHTAQQRDSKHHVVLQDNASLHGAIIRPNGRLSLDWLRQAPPEVASAFLMSVEGLGRKSVACIMLLCLRMREFPVDVNVGRICSRLGWIPLDVESAFEVDKYAPELEVHKYLHSRLASFDAGSLYELHYQMITLGKVFCSKVSPNCGACPMQATCEYALSNGKRFQPKQPKADEQDAGQAENAMADADYRHAKAKQASADIEDWAPATPTNTVAAPLLQIPTRAVQQPAHAASVTLPGHLSVSSAAEHAMHAGLTNSNFAEEGLGQQLNSQSVAVQHLEAYEHAGLAGVDHQSKPFKDAVSEATSKATRAAACMSNRDTMNKAKTGSRCKSSRETMIETMNEAEDEAMNEAMRVTGCKSTSGALIGAMTEAKCESKRGAVRETRCAEDVVASLLKLGKTLNDTASMSEDRLLAAAAEAFQVDGCTAPAAGGEAAGMLRRRMRELSMVVHPDKCKLNGAEAAFATLQQAYSILQRHHHQNLPATLHPSVQQQPAGTQHNRRLLQCYELPLSCSDLLPTHLQAAAEGLSELPILAVPLQTGADHTQSGLPSLALRLQSPLMLPLLHFSAQDAMKSLPWHAPKHPVNSCESLSSVHAENSTAAAAATAAAPPLMVNDTAATSYCQQQGSFKLSAAAGADCKAGQDSAFNSSETAGRRVSACTAGTCTNSAFEQDSYCQSGTPTTAAGSACTAGTAGAVDVASLKAAALKLDTSQEAVGCCPTDSEEQEEELVPVALLIHCRRATNNKFPLNGTFFQVNEVFLDQATVSEPFQVPMSMLEGCKHRSVYSGTQAASICRGMTQGQVAYLFNQAFTCVRAYNSLTGMPAALPAWMLPPVPQSAKPRGAPPDPSSNPRPKKTKAAPLDPSGGFLPKVTKAAPLEPPARPLQKKTKAAPLDPSANPRPKKAKAAVHAESSQSKPAEAAEHAMPAGPSVSHKGKQERLTSPVRRVMVHKQHRRLKQKLDKNKEPRGRIQLFKSMKASERCGVCQTCMKPALKKACLTRRAEMQAALQSSNIEDAKATHESSSIDNELAARESGSIEYVQASHESICIEGYAGSS